MLLEKLEIFILKAKTKKVAQHNGEEQKRNVAALLCVLNANNNAVEVEVETVNSLLEASLLGAQFDCLIVATGNWPDTKRPKQREPWVSKQTSMGLSYIHASNNNQTTTTPNQTRTQQNRTEPNRTEPDCAPKFGLECSAQFPVNFRRW